MDDDLLAELAEIEVRLGRQVARLAAAARDLRRIAEKMRALPSTEVERVAVLAADVEAIADRLAEDQRR